jgi:hypothetical protein
MRNEAHRYVGYGGHRYTAVVVARQQEGCRSGFLSMAPHTCLTTHGLTCFSTWIEPPKINQNFTQEEV